MYTSLYIFALTVWTISLTLFTGHFNDPCDGDHVSRHTAVHQVLRELTFNGARDSTGLTLVT